LKDLLGVPEEALESSSKESPISHRLAETSRGWAWRRSRFTLFFGAALIAIGWAVFKVISHVVPDGSLRYAMSGIVCGTGLLCWGIYGLGRLCGLRVSFDLAHNYAAIRRGWRTVERYPLSELAAIQICYRYDGHIRAGQDAEPRETGIAGMMEDFLVKRFNEGKALEGDDYQLVLVRRRQDGALERRWILSTSVVSEVRKLGERTARAVKVAFLDCATPDHVQRVRSEFLSSGGSLPRPNRE